MVGRNKTLCMLCFGYYGDQMSRHAKRCKFAPTGMTEAARHELGHLYARRYRAATYNMNTNICVNPRHLKKSFYSKDEVLKLFEQYGHTIVPPPFQQVYALKPQANDLHSLLERNKASPTQSKEAGMSPYMPVMRPNLVSEPLTGADVCLDIDVNSDAESDLELQKFSISSSAKRRPRVIASSSDDDSDATGSGNCRKMDYEITTDSRVDKPTPGCSSWRDESPSRDTTGTDGSNETVASRKNKKKSRREPALEDDGRCDCAKEVEKEERSTIVKSPCYKKGVTGSLTDAGSSDVPQEFCNNVVFEQFAATYDALHVFKSKREKDCNISNVIKMIYLMGDRSLVYLTKCLNVKSYQKGNAFLLENGANYQTLHNYNESMNSFIKFEIRRLKNVADDADYRERKRLEMVVEDVIEIGTSLDKRVEADRPTSEPAEPSVTEPVPSPYEIQEVIRAYSNEFDDVMDRARHHMLNKDEVCFVNRFMSTYFMLTQGTRSSALENLTKALVLHSINTRTYGNGDDATCVVHTIQQKTAEECTPVIVLTSEWIDIFEAYNLYVRQEIVVRTQSQARWFFLQRDGSAFTKMSEAPGKLQTKKCIPHHSACDARKSYTTYSHNLPQSGQRDMAEFFSSSNQTGGTPETHSAGETLQSFDCDDDSEKGLNVDNDLLRPSSPQSGAEKTPMKCSARGPTKRLRETTSTDDLVNRRKIHTKAARLRPHRKSPVSPPPAASPLTIHQQADRLEREMVAKYGDLISARIPGASELQRHHGLTQTVATKLNRKLRYRVEKAREQKCAEKLLKEEAKRRRVRVADLDKIPDFPEDDSMLASITNGAMVSAERITKYMTEQLRKERYSTYGEEEFSPVN